MKCIALILLLYLAIAPTSYAHLTCALHQSFPVDKAHYAAEHNATGHDDCEDEEVEAPPATRTPRPTSVAYEDDACYSHDTAYITGVMNIRARHTTASDVVGQTRAGYIYKVLGSLQGPAYCWLDIDGQWIAVTGVVSSEDRRVGVPPISGADATLTQRLGDAMDFLRTHAHQWFDYVATVMKGIFSNRREGSWAMALKPWGAGAYVPYGKTYVWGDNERLRSLTFLTSLLVHEACHHHQAADGRLASLSNREKEVECWGKQINYIRDVSPRSLYIAELTRGLRNL